MLVAPPTASGPFVPPAGLVDWLKADDTSKVVTQSTDDGLNVDGGAPVDGHFIYTWSDSGGGAIEFGPNNGNSPTWVASGINGLASVKFDPSGHNEFLSTTQFSALGLTDVEVFIVTKSTAAGGTHGLWDFGTSADAEWYPIDAAGGVYEAFAASVRVGPVARPDLSLAHVYNVRAAAGGAYDVGWDGTVTSSTSGNTVGFPATCRLGLALTGGGSPYDGMIGEMLVFDHVLSSGDRTAVLAYLQAKWGTP